MSFRRKPCKFYLRGHCHHGDRCTFMHEDAKEEGVGEGKNVVLIIADIDHQGEPWLNRSFGKIIGYNLSLFGYPPLSNVYVRTLSRLMSEGYKIFSMDIMDNKRVLVHLVLDKGQSGEESRSVCDGYPVEL